MTPQLNDYVECDILLLELFMVLSYLLHIRLSHETIAKVLYRLCNKNFFYSHMVTLYFFVSQYAM